MFFKSIESIVVLPQKYSNFFTNIDFNSNDCFLTFGNDGLVKIWNWKNAKLIYKQKAEESLKIENTREKDSNLQQVIVNAFYHESLDLIVLTTVDKLIAFVQLDVDKVFSIEKQVKLFF
jgi:WD40 repeat protein